MIVDILLKLIGENPEQFQNDIQDKYIVIFLELFDLFLIVLPYLMFLLPWLWVYGRKKKNKLITRSLVFVIFVLSIVLLIAGFYVPDVVDYLVAIIGIRSYYGM
jgi:hypothetical protein